VTQLARFIPDPQIVVRVVRYGSQAVSVTGEVGSASRQFLTEQPLTLLDAIDASGGLNENADPGRVIVRRKGEVHTVDLQAFLERGDARGNPLLLDGDVVSVPKRRLLEAYLLGQIVKPSTIDLSVDDVTLTQALTRVGGLVEERADARGVFVFRNTPDGVQVFQLDVGSPVAFLLGTRFMLRPEDVVYVTTAPVSKWNAIITSLLPSLSATSATVTLARSTND
jgi:polysaccharide export outer membrane protein